MTTLTMKEKAELQKSIINKNVQPSEQQAIISTFQESIVNILSECESLHKGPNYSTSESQAARSAIVHIRGDYDSIKDLYDLQVALHKANQYNLPIECDRAISIPLELLQSKISKYYEHSDGLTDTFTGNISQIVDIMLDTQ